jgi:hypothetical protein
MSTIKIFCDRPRQLGIVVTTLLPEKSQLEFRFRSRIFSFFHIVQNNSVVHPTTCPTQGVGA